MADVIGLPDGVRACTDDKLVGTWKLVSASSTTSAGERSETPYGPSPVGFLTYTAEGRVTAMISYDGRESLSFGGGTQEQQAEAFKTFLAYAGRYELSGDKVIHHVEISSLQNFVGMDLIRFIKFECNRMVLVSPPMSINRKTQTIELVWERLPTQFEDKK